MPLGNKYQERLIWEALQEQTHYCLASAFSILIWGNLNQSIYTENQLSPMVMDLLKLCLSPKRLHFN